MRGPRPANNRPEWGSGGGPEYYKGWSGQIMANMASNTAGYLSLDEC